MNDPEDVQRFQLNLMCDDIVAVMRDHTGGKRIGPLPIALAEKFTNLAVSIKQLNEATAPKDYKGGNA